MCVLESVRYILCNEHLSVFMQVSLATDIAGAPKILLPFPPSQGILNACFVVHWILAATSLLLQFLFPLRGMTNGCMIPGEVIMCF